MVERAPEVPLLTTKLHVPRRRRGIVGRPRLLDLLRRGDEAALTLVSAPAGFGKTTLLTDWLATGPEGCTTAWLSLDERDDDPPVFWSYLVAVVAAMVSEPGGASLRTLGEVPSEAALTTLLNALGALDDDAVLVLDDYHVIQSPPIHDAMTFVVEHLPANVRLVMATRADPPLPLARLRARGDVVEVRAADLRFTAEEAGSYLNGSMGLHLEAADVDALESRTEGWAAALQLAALSMQGRDDPAGFIATFAGDDRYIVDYLVGEVLQRQTDPVTDFLLQTAILDRFDGSLCDAVTGVDGGAETLADLDRANLFLVPLDDRRRWYRYHHLFADVLRARLRDERPDLVDELHARASDWFERSGDRPEAIRHAMEGGHVELAAALIELAMPAMRQSRQEATIRRWLEALPAELFATRPVLSVGFAGVLAASGQVERIETLLGNAERWLDLPADHPQRVAEMVVADAGELDRLPAFIAVFRAAMARGAGDVSGTITYAERALGLVGDDDPLGRGAASGLLALARWTNGDLEAAHRSWSTSRASLEQAGHVSDTFGVTIALADIRVAQGRLDDAWRTYEQAFELARSTGGPPLRGTADLHVGLADLCRERNDLDAAERHLRLAEELGTEAGLPQNAHRSLVVGARLRIARGDLAGAVERLDQAERAYVGDFFPDVRPIAALRARIWMAQGEFDRARGWARERNLAVDDELTYLGEHDHLVLARVLLGDPDEDSSGLLARLLEAAERGQRWGSAIEIRVVQARAHQARGDQTAALAALAPALERARTEGHARVFLDEGAPLVALLAAADGDPAARILAAADADAATNLGPTRRGSVDAAVLIDPLSARELDVLRLLQGDLSGPDIARELVVSLNTVRTHTKSIYAKLGVNDRRGAVRRAAELGL